MAHPVHAGYVASADGVVGIVVKTIPNILIDRWGNDIYDHTELSKGIEWTVSAEGGRIVGLTITIERDQQVATE